LLNRKPDLPLFVITEVSRDPDSFFVSFMHNMPSDKNPFIAFLQQMSDEMEAGKIRKMDPRALWFNILALVVFPFLARPMLQRQTATSEEQFDSLLADRAQHLKQFIRSAIEIK
jgi:TetR/AcrR family transcriptional regulator